MIKNVFRKKEFLVVFSMLNVEILFFLVVFGSFLSLILVCFSLFTISLTFFLLVVTTQNYQLYRKKSFLKRMTINGFETKKVKIILFLKMVFYGIIFLFVWTFYLFLFNKIGFGFNSNNIDKVINWKIFPFLNFYYYGLSEVIMIIIFGYVINKLGRKPQIIYGIIIAITIYLIVDNSLFVLPLRVRTFDNNHYLVWANNNFKRKIKFNSLMFPWTTFDLFGKPMFIESSFIAKFSAKDIRWFDMSHMNDYFHTDYGYFYSSLLWTPFIYMLIPYGAIKLKALGRSKILGTSKKS